MSDLIEKILSKPEKEIPNSGSERLSYNIYKHRLNTVFDIMEDMAKIAQKREYKLTADQLIHLTQAAVTYLN